MPNASFLQKYRLLRGLLYWLIAGQVIFFFVSIQKGLFTWDVLTYFLRLQPGAERGETISSVRVQGKLLSFVTPLSLYLDALLMVLFLLWIYRASANLPALNAQNQKFTPAKAVASFFVPIANLILPRFILQEIWRGSTPDGDLVDGSSWYTVSSPKRAYLVNAWWGTYILHIISVLILLIIAKIHKDAPFLGLSISLLMKYRLTLVGILLDLVYMMLLYLLVSGVTRHQDRRYQRLMGTAPAKPHSRLAVLRTMTGPAAVAALCLALEIGFLTKREQTVTAALSSDWKIYTGQKMRFTVEAPGKPFVHTVRPKTLSLTKALTTFMAADMTTEYYVIMNQFFDRNIIGIRWMTSMVSNSMKARFKATIEDMRPLSTRDGIAFEASLNFGTSQKGTGRFFFRDDTLYEVVAIPERADADPDNMRRFVTSFKLAQNEGDANTLDDGLAFTGR